MRGIFGSSFNFLNMIKIDKNVILCKKPHIRYNVGYYSTLHFRKFFSTSQARLFCGWNWWQSLELDFSTSLRFEKSTNSIFGDLIFFLYLAKIMKEWSVVVRATSLIIVFHNLFVFIYLFVLPFIIQSATLNFPPRGHKWAWWANS